MEERPHVVDMLAYLQTKIGLKKRATEGDAIERMRANHQLRALQRVRRKLGDRQGGF